MANETVVPKKKANTNPFQKLGDETETIGAAKSGAVVSGYIALSYALQVAFLYWSGKDLFGDTGIGPLVIDAVAFVLAGLLTWRIVVRQPLCATILAAAWFAFELAVKIAAIVSGAQSAAGLGYIVMYFFIASAAILSVRASWRLRVLRKGSVKSETVPEVFD